MAKKQSRRSISLSRSTYERLRSYCETNGISMSQFVEHRVGDFLGRSTRVRPGSTTVPDVAEELPSAPQLTVPQVMASAPAPVPAQPRPERRPAPPPAVPTPDHIFTF